MNQSLVLEITKILIAVSIFFVWVVRYENIVKEFKEYELSNSIRDFVGILKLSFAFMLLTKVSALIIVANVGFIVLMLAALMTHVKVKNPIHKMIPALSLLILNAFLLTQYI